MGGESHGHILEPAKPAARRTVAGRAGQRCPGACLDRSEGRQPPAGPGAAAAQMVEAIVKNESRVYPVCAHLTGEYGLNNVFVGVPVRMGKNGIEDIFELKLNADEMKLLHDSAAAVKEVMDVFDKM